MNLLDLQILFQQKIEDVNVVFSAEQRPDTFTIIKYLNKSIDQFLEKKYLTLSSFEQRLVMIESNYDELSGLIVKSDDLSSKRDLKGYNWASRGDRYRIPDNVLVPISLSCTVSRGDVYPMSDQLLFAQWVSRRQAERLISTSADKVMYSKPVVLLEDPYYILLIGDAYTTSLTAGSLLYIRKPFKLSYDYSELESSGIDDLAISDIETDSYFLMMSYGNYYDANDVATVYAPGDKVKKLSSRNLITYNPTYGETLKVGYPWGHTDTPEFPDYVHDTILENAVSLFLDQAKLKLVQKSE